MDDIKRIASSFFLLFIIVSMFSVNAFAEATSVDNLAPKTTQAVTEATTEAVTEATTQPTTQPTTQLTTQPTTKPATTKPTITEKPTYEKPEWGAYCWLDILDNQGSKEYYYEYVYTGSVIHPKIKVSYWDNRKVSKDDYIVYYRGDCKSVGLHEVYIQDKATGETNGVAFEIVPNRTSRVDMEYKDGKVILSWAPVKGAGYYRFHLYDSSTGSYEGSYLYDVNGNTGTTGTSATFSSNTLKPGKTYRIAIIAVKQKGSFPTSIYRDFYLTVPTSGNVKNNIYPGYSSKPVATTENKVSVNTTENKSSVTANASEADSSTIVADITATIVESQTVLITEYETTSVPAKNQEDPQQNKVPLIVGSVVALLGIGFALVYVIKKKRK